MVESAYRENTLICTCVMYCSVYFLPLVLYADFTSFLDLFSSHLFVPISANLMMKNLEHVSTF